MWAVLGQAIHQRQAATGPLLPLCLPLRLPVLAAIRAAAAAAVCVRQEELKAHPPHCQLRDGRRKLLWGGGGGMGQAAGW